MQRREGDESEGKDTRSDAWRVKMSLWKQAHYLVGIHLSEGFEVLHIVCIRRCENGEKLLSNLDGNSDPRLALATVKKKIEEQKKIEERKGEAIQENKWVARMLWESPSLLL